MKVSSAKENIFKKIRQALSNSVPVPFPQSENAENVFQPQTQELSVQFAENFSMLQGRFSFCLNGKELADQLNQLVATRKWENIFCREDELKQMLSKNGFENFNAADLKTCDAAITGCEQLIARTGSIVLSSAQQSGRTVSVYAPVHICIAYTSQLVYNIKEALQNVKNNHPQLPSVISLASGPSRTADIEKTLVVGVHGPKEVFCFLMEDGV